MMYFGWRPQPSCYVQDGQVVPNQAQSCESPTWWYWLLGGAFLAGMAARKK